MRKATARGVALAVDVNWRPTFWDPAASPASGPSAAAIARMRPLLGQATLIKCAAEEAQWLFGSADPEEIAAALPQRPLVLVSDGAQPLRWCWGAITGCQRPFAVEVVDSTGAGDALMAGVLHRLCQLPQLGAASASAPASASEAEIQALMRFASACGALVCAGAGAIDPQPSEAEVHQGPAGGALVVLGQSKGGAGDRFADAQTRCQALHQAGFAGPKIPDQQQEAAGCQLLGQLPAKGQGGGGIAEPPMEGTVHRLSRPPCRLAFQRARSLGVSADISQILLPAGLLRSVRWPHKASRLVES